MALSKLDPRALSRTMAVLYTFIFVSQLCSFASSISETAASLQSQQEEKLSEELICTTLTSQVATLRGQTRSESSHGDRRTTIYMCENLGSDFSNELLHWIILSGNNGRGVCLEETLVSWYIHCVKLPSLILRRTLEQTDMSSSHTDITTNCTNMNRSTTSTRHVDFLFLIEYPRTVNVNISLQLVNAVRNLEKEMKTRANDVNSRFAFVLYPLHGEHHTRVIDFSPNVSDVVETLFVQQIKSSDRNVPAEDQSNVLTDGRLLHYVSVSNSLKKVSNFLKLRDKNEPKLSSRDRDSTVNHRNYADLHILSFMDLSSKNKTTQSDTKLKIDRLLDRAKENIEEQIKIIIDDFQISSTNDHRTSLHFFFSSSNSAARSFLGDPQHSIRYSDCSHFNKALTLKALLSSNDKSQSDSLQAHVLSQGIELQVHSLNDLQKKSCLSGVTPTLSTPSGLEYTFTNICQDCATGSQSHHGFYCSPLHGWTVKDATQGSKKKKKKSELFEGKAPLSNQFLASHADLLKPAVTSLADNNDTTDSVRLPLVQLTVNKELDLNQRSNFEPVIEGHPHIVQWSPDKPFVVKMISKRRPTVLRNTVVQTWPALQKWNLSYIENNMGIDILPSVKCTNTFLTFDPDRSTPLKLNISLPFTPVNMSTESFFRCIQRDSNDPVCSDGYKGHYYFGGVPDMLKDDVLPDHFLYHTEKDYEANKQFMWISSAGMITHTHFDQDFNFFVQLVGKKRFTLWSPEQHELMYVHPRVHPMWHKSRVNYRAVDLDRFPAFTQVRGKQIELGPGDMLFVPPYTWHYVETLTPSVSLSTWSHDYNLYDHMNSIYRHDHKFDLLEDQRGQMFVLRLYLDMMVHSLYGFNQTTQFFAQLVNNRYAGLEHLFPASEDDPDICSAAVPGKIPTCVHVHGYAKLDMTVIGSHFEMLQPEVRDILFQDYVEEIAAQVVGVKKMLAFFRYCFLGQDYYITDINDEEHLLWEHKYLDATN